MRDLSPPVVKSRDQTRINSSDFQRRLFFWVAVFIILAIGAGFYLTVRAQELKRFQMMGERIAANQGRIVAHRLQDIASCLWLLSGETIFHGGMGRVAEPDLVHIGREYLSLARFRPEITRIILFDQNGREVIRTIRSGDRPRLVYPGDPETMPVDFYYLRPGQTKLWAGGSALWPAFCIVQALPGVEEGSPCGFLFLEYSSGPLLAELRKLAEPTIGRVMLLRLDGSWVLAPPEDDIRHQLNEFDPKAWSAINASPQASVLTINGLFSSNTIDVAEHINEAAREAGLELPGAMAPLWLVVSRVDNPRLRVESDSLLVKLVVLIGMVLILLTVASLVADRYRRERTEALDQLNTLSQAVEQSPTVVVITDTDGNIVYVNPKFSETTGYSSLEALGQNPRILKSGRQPKEVYEQLWKTIREGRVWRGELCNKHKNGHEYWEFATISPIFDSEGRVTSYMAIKEDISERKRAEVKLRQAMEAAEAANRAKTEFLANMSHEIRTPMNGIIGMVDLTLETELDEIQKEYLTLVKQSANSLMILLTGILDLAKLETGGFDLDRVGFSLRETLSGALVTAEQAAEEKGLDLTLEIDPEAPDFLVGDPKRLQQILINLVGNAVKFTEKGSVSVTVANQSRTEDEVELLFSVTDTGIGIPAEKQREIFSPFTQGDGSMTRQYGGTGLGLSIAGQLADLMGGRIWVESSKGEGSIFRFTAVFDLDHAGADDAQDGSDRKPLPVLGNLRILLVEDEALNQQMAANFLMKKGHVVVVASSGEEALDLLAGSPYDLVLIDIRLPGINGMETTRRLREMEDSSGRRTPVIAMTTRQVDKGLDSFLEAGMDGYLHKPVNSENLLRVITETMARSAWDGDGPGGESTPAEKIVVDNVEGTGADVADERELLERVQGDRELLKELIDSFLVDLDRHQDRIREATQAQDSETLRRQVQSLKGEAAHFGARATRYALEKLEELARSCDFRDADAACAYLDRELERLRTALTLISNKNG